MLTGSSGGSGTSSSASSLAASPSASASSRSSSVASKPTRSRSKRSSRSQASSSASSASLPSRLQGELVIRDQVGPLLRLAQVLEADHRHLGEAELARREQPAVTGEDAALLVDQHRVGPAELDHGRRDLIDLRLAVRARIPLVRAQAVDRPQLDPVGERDQPGAHRCVGQRANLVVRRGANGCDTCRRRRSSEPQGSCRFQAVECDGVVRTCGCDGCDGRFAPVAAEKARDCGFRWIRCESQCDGCDG